jgi:hypothetical protein
VLRLDAGGAIVWQNSYGGSREDWANGIIPTTDGGFAVAGYRGRFPHYDSWVFKLDAGGAIVWQNTYSANGSDQAHSLVTAADGGYGVAGNVFVVLKLDAVGGIGADCGLVQASDATIIPAGGTARSSTGVAATSGAIPADSAAVTTDTTGYRVVPNGYQVGAQIGIVDETNASAPSARVAVQVSLPDGSTVNRLGTTGSTGRAVVGVQSSLAGTYIFTVMGVREAGYFYDPAHNVETSDSVTVP